MEEKEVEGTQRSVGEVRARPRTQRNHTQTEIKHSNSNNLLLALGRAAGISAAGKQPNKEKIFNVEKPWHLQAATCDPRLDFLYL